MTSLIVDYLVKSIVLFLFDFYFIWNPLNIEEDEKEKEPTFLEELSSFILDE
jgi:hypothetical protein